MKHYGLRYQVILLFGSLILVKLICNCGNSTLSYPDSSIPITQEAAHQLKQNFYQAVQESDPDYEAKLHITEEEATSLLAQALAETNRIPFLNPQLRFQKDKICLTGQFSLLGWGQKKIVLIASVSLVAGQQMIQIEQGSVDSFNLPDPILTTLTQTLNEAFQDISHNFEITQLKIREGEVIVFGKRRYHPQLTPPHQIVHQQTPGHQKAEYLPPFHLFQQSAREPLVLDQ